MNTVKSFWVGWGALCVAGGGAYYFAKKSINAEKMERFEAEQKRKRLQNSFGNPPPRTALLDGNSSQNPITSPALHGQDTTTGQKDAEEINKIEPKQQFRSLKGDRFS
ncbi:hypothetical protein BGHDH14_bgh06841 [Blumeria hordei DH14]|uniref:Uncharacterized protein n=1 Tax=Blumeria graminis f. sp. hordei (strain DH14) TaxID=546991 RepID=N1JFT0_BLUG1|nr:hypothetical protein BGHDH14_bgh06841 [Blumeria hordei DH14]